MLWFLFFFCITRPPQMKGYLGKSFTLRGFSYRSNELENPRFPSTSMSRSVFPAGWREISDRELNPFSGVNATTILNVGGGREEGSLKDKGMKANKKKKPHPGSVLTVRLREGTAPRFPIAQRDRQREREQARALCVLLQPACRAGRGILLH